MFSRSADYPRRRVWVWIVVASLGFACETVPVPFEVAKPFDPGETTGLPPDHGILVVHTRSDTPLDSLRFTAGDAAMRLTRGEHIGFVLVPAGEYKWTELRVVHGSDYLIWDVENVDDDAYFTFRVEPGVLNYPGQLRVRDRWLRIVNRSAFLLEALEDENPELLDRFPIRFTGRVPDPFLAEYARLRAERAAAPPEGSRP